MRICQKLIALGILFFALPVLGQGMPPLVQAAKDADWQKLAALLSAENTVQAVYGDGSSALHWASYHDNVEVALALIEAGSDVNAVTDLGVSPLWLAADNGSSAMADALLNNGANPNLNLLSGETLVMTAAHTGNAALLRALLAAGANPNGAVTRDQTALMWAAGQGHAEVVAALVDYGAEVDARTLVRTQYVKSEKEQDSHPLNKVWVEQGGYTALMFAARAGSLESARSLVAAGADVNGLSAFGTSPLIMAVHGGNIELLSFLLDNGAELESSASGHTALHAAILRGSLEAVELLLDHGANIEAILQKPTPARRQSADYNFHDSLIGATPLWLAARFTEPKIITLLIERGADPFFVKDVTYPTLRGLEPVIAEEGEISVLMAAVGMGYRRLRMSWGSAQRRAGLEGNDTEARILEAVEIAVATGIDSNLQDAEGVTARDFARARRYEEVFAFLDIVGR
ncbi:MAG: ankyrin repeat domain-containing protein [Pseudohongiellaceae bacterium]